MIMVMYTFAAGSQLDNALNHSKDTLGGFTDTYLSGKSVLVFVIAMATALILGRIIAAILRTVARSISRRADKAESLQTVNQLRRIETLIVLTVALQKVILVAIAGYVWWVYIHPNQQSTGLIGASALLLLVLSATISPILRDLASGGIMMAEHWFGVGDFVKIEPFGDLQGVVERVTLRSTRIRGLNGEIIWLSNQNIQGVRVSPKGVRTMAIDLFVNDLVAGLALVEAANLRLPVSPLTVIRPLRIMSQNEVGSGLWHITAIGETAPGREWLLENYVIKIMSEVDEDNKHAVLATEPIARYADSEAERRFARTVQNARKSTLRRKRLPLPETLTDQITKPLDKIATRQAKKRHNKRVQ